MEQFDDLELGEELRSLLTDDSLSLSRVACTEHLLDFVREAWTIIEPGQPFVENWHIVEICNELEAMEKGLIRRSVINVPPGTMKSLLVSVFFPCWLWAKNPKLRILTATYSDKRAMDANLKARKILTSQWFQDRWKVTFSDDQDTKGRFDTSVGGWRIATSVGGEGTGLHPDYIIIDDASTALDALSAAKRKEVNDWFRNTISTRGISRGVALIVMGQRLHEEDLPGFILAGPTGAAWSHICFPMRFEPTREDTPTKRGYRADPRDPRTTPGELLWPALFSEATIAQLEITLGPYDAAGQLQQQPSPEGGGMFKMEWFADKIVDTLPAMYIAVRGWDVAGTDGAGDWSAGVKILEELQSQTLNGRTEVKRTGKFFVADVQHDQLSPDKVDLLMKATAELDGKKCAVREEQEPGASGKSVVQARARLLVGYDYEEVTIGGSKVTRSKPYRAQCAAGNVYLLRGEWNGKYLRELCVFPTGKHDDQVDGSSTAFNALVIMDIPQEDWIRW